METTIITVDNPDWVKLAVGVVQAGGIVAFPTDTVYGIGADLFQPDAVARLYEVKRRSTEKAIPILLGSKEDLPKVVGDIPEFADRLAQEFWPGALTIVLPKSSSVPTIVSSTGTIGVRVPDHPVAQQLLRAVGPLAATSANLSGTIEAIEATEVYKQLGGTIELIVDAGVTPGGRPSTVIDCTVKPATILREGPISSDRLFRS
jgi:L-threonylcarbamoyladenylate synthase